MKNAKLSKGLKRLFIINGVTVGLYLIALLLFAVLARSSGDADIAGFRVIMRYYLKGMLDLFTFSYAGNTNIVYFALSIFLYALIVCWIILLIAGIVVMDKKQRKVVWFGIVFTFINLGIYLLFAAGSQKYWQILNNRGGLAGNKGLMFMTIIIVALGLIYFLLSLVAYFWSIIDSFIAGRKLFIDDEDVQPVDQLDDQQIRSIVRDELIKNQPFKVIIVEDERIKEQPKVEEQAQPVAEPQKEVATEKVEEKPKPVVVKEYKHPYSKPVTFEEAVLEIWPQIANAPALRIAPKEEQEVLASAEENDDDLNSMKKGPRLPFIKRVLTADSDIKVNYNEIKNELLSYGVKARLSRGGETVRLKDKRYAKIYLVGKTLKVYLALNPEDYKDSTIPVEDVGHRPAYAEIPLLFKVRSGLSVRRCKDLIKSAMEKDGLSQGEVKNTNWVSELRKINSEKSKNK